jgi:cytochrome c nitrite reductase small subunit
MARFWLLAWIEPSMVLDNQQSRARRRVRNLLLVLLASGTGALLGIGGFTFRYAEGLSYLQSDPSACANCHIMQSQYDGWQKSSHHTVAVCVDCHLPHEGAAKWLAKLENGYRHSEKFTSQTFVEPIVVQERGSRILQENCVRCHADLTASMNAGSHSTNGGTNQSVVCVRCHATVGHGDIARLGGPLTRAELKEIGIDERQGR